MNTSAFVKLCIFPEHERIFVALAKTQYDLFKVLHNSDSSTIHQVKSGHIIRFDELVRITKSRKIPAVYSNHNPAIWQAVVVSFEFLHILEFALSHCRQA